MDHGSHKRKDLPEEEKKDILATNKEQASSKKKSSYKTVFKSLGPGIITGASDDDPSRIPTYSQAGAKFGFGMLWLVLFQYPMMTVIRDVCTYWSCYG